MPHAIRLLNIGIGGDCHVYAVLAVVLKYIERRREPWVGLAGPLVIINYRDDSVLKSDLGWHY
jgi:hypothetical protein